MSRDRRPIAVGTRFPGSREVGMDSNVYDEDYFMRGVETKKSLYNSYSWRPELTLPMVQKIIDHLGIDKWTSVLDFGCARGYVVKAFRLMQYNQVYGFDISRWALDNADPEICHLLTRLPEIAFAPQYDWIIAKDVLEHVKDVGDTVVQLMDHAAQGVFAVVPLSPFDGAPYVVEDYEKDVTHIHRLALPSWAAMFMRPGWHVDVRYRLQGVKDNYAQYPDGNGFITCRRIGG